ncbi:MAG: hypothetical protein ACR2J1_03355 [Methyloceanibacter sp.]|uniref:hypothetical protein n=1 Tax=Methyloceanibacter sp. TaxID=1965321 RepID=UPI003D9ABB1A
MRLFWRYWAWLAALPVLLLFLAVYRRIDDYGVTEHRYVMVLIAFGSWCWPPFASGRAASSISASCPGSLR